MTPPVERPKRIVFVCVENSNRSQIAEAFARLHGGERVEAYSAGSRPSGKVNPRAVEFMREVGYDLTAHRSKGIADLPAVEFDAVVGMGCGDEGCPLVRRGGARSGPSRTRRSCRRSSIARCATGSRRRSNDCWRTCHERAVTSPKRKRGVERKPSLALFEVAHFAGQKE